MEEISNNKVLLLIFSDDYSVFLFNSIPAFSIKY